MSMHNEDDITYIPTPQIRCADIYRVNSEKTKIFCTICFRFSVDYEWSEENINKMYHHYLEHLKQGFSEDYEDEDEE